MPKYKMGLFLPTNNSLLKSLTFQPLNPHEDTQYWDQAASLAEEKWGYIRRFPGVDERKKLIRNPKYHFYIMRYAEHFIGMFALLNYPIDFQTKIKAQELVSFYVCEEFRSFGVGAALFKEALKICHKHQANTLVWDTLNPNLNGFWQRRHAQIVCDSQILGQPTTLFRIDVPKPS